MISIKIAADRPSALYRLGEKVRFLIGVYENEKPLKSGQVAVRLSSDTEAVFHDRKYDLAAANPLRLEWGMSVPGFLRCTALAAGAGQEIKGEAAAAFEPENLLPVLPEPEDFDAFWREGIRRLAAVPDDARLERLGDHCCAQYECFKVSFANINDTRIYGYLSVPAGKGPFPALIIVPGAGASASAPNTLWVKEGVVTLLMNVHAYDPPQDAGAHGELFRKLVAEKHYYCHGLEDREKYFFRRAILGIYRAIEWLARRQDVDPDRLVFSGSSQGGTMAFYQAGLSSRLTAALAVVPGMGDHGGFLIGRHPHTARFPGFSEHLDTLAYYDIVNFARRVRCPVMMGVGFLDDLCFPGNCYPAYNALACEKTVINAVECGHALDTDKYYGQFFYWVRQKLGIAQKLT